MTRNRAAFHYSTSPIARNFSNNKHYFKSGLSCNIINGTRNTNNLESKYILPSVNDVGGMKLTSSEEAKKLLSDKFRDSAPKTSHQSKKPFPSSGAS
jgi:hypothetical protein